MSLLIGSVVFIVDFILRKRLTVMLETDNHSPLILSKKAAIIYFATLIFSNQLIQTLTYPYGHDVESNEP